MTQQILKDQIHQMFDSGTFRDTGHALIDLLADYRRRHPKAAALLSRGVLGEELTDDPEAVRRLATELRALRLEPVSREA